jgi:3-oxoacyl-(acyl-carrier-protein) synthase
MTCRHAGGDARGALRDRAAGVPRRRPAVDPDRRAGPGYDPEALFNRQQIALYDRFTQFTLIAAREAMAQAGLTFAGDLAARRAWCWARGGG